MSQEIKKSKKGFAKTSAEPEIAQRDPSNLQNAIKKIEEGFARVICGITDRELRIVGATVGEVRAQLVDMFNIPANALALMNGGEVSADYVIKANDVLEFSQKLGTKG